MSATAAPAGWELGRHTHSVGAVTTVGEGPQHFGEGAGEGRLHSETRRGARGTEVRAVPRVQVGHPPWTNLGGKGKVDRSLRFQPRHQAPAEVTVGVSVSNRVDTQEARAVPGGRRWSARSFALAAALSPQCHPCPPSRLGPTWPSPPRSRHCLPPWRGTLFTLFLCGHGQLPGPTALPGTRDDFLDARGATGQHINVYLLAHLRHGGRSNALMFLHCVYRHFWEPPLSRLCL